MKGRLARTLTLVVIALFAGTPPLTSAAPAGTAWDAVTKMAMGADPSSLQPGSFDDDFATASSTQIQSTGGGGFFAQVKQAMSAGQNVGQLMQNGLAEKHYVAGSKERIDEIAAQTAVITDCVARTITTLDLHRKTYRVVSMDQPSTPSSSTRNRSGAPSDDGSKIAIVVTNTALGSREVGGQPTNGFRTDMTFTVTKPSGESKTQNASLVGYYASLATPFPRCAGARGWSGAGAPAGQGMAMMAGVSRLMHALASAGMDKRFSIKQSGPALPFGNLSMYQAVAFGAEQGRAATFVFERGHVRSIAADDPIFSVPSDFTAAQ